MLMEDRDRDRQTNRDSQRHRHTDIYSLRGGGGKDR